MRRIFQRARGALFGPSLALALGVVAAAGAVANPTSTLLPTADTVLDARELRARAEQGDKRAAFLLASRYASGRGGVRDDSEAVLWYRKAAEGGLAEAQYNLGIMYASGRGVAPDLGEAARWFQRAADQGLAEAQFNLGTLYVTGRGVPRDEARAAALLRQAAARGLAQAQHNLGVLHEHGMGVRLNAHEALDWYRKAEEAGYEPAGVRRRQLEARLQTPAPAAGAQPPVVAGGGDGTGVHRPPPARRGAGSVAVPGAGAAAGDRVSAWVASLSPARYTVQLASFRSLDDAKRFQGTLPPGTVSGLYRSRKKGGRWYSVVYGVYASYDEAQAAVDALPARLRRARPWVRKVARVHKEID